MGILEEIDKKAKAYRQSNERTWRELYDFSDETIGIIVGAYRAGLHVGMGLTPTRKRKTTRKQTNKANKS